MAGRQRKSSPSKQGYTTTPNVRQKHFPSLKQTISSSTSLAWSAPNKRQRTITQMDPFYTIFHPHLDQENLEYEKDLDDVPEESSIRPKQRKLQLEETPVHRMTRSANKKVAASAPTIRYKSRSVDQKGGELVPKKEDVILMSSLKTPKSNSRREIPSSQSPPAESPLSTHSWRWIHDLSKSPLKERSTNVMLQPSSRKSASWKGRREVPDSMENLEDESSFPSDSSLKSATASNHHGREKSGPRGRPTIPSQRSNDSRNDRNSNDSMEYPLDQTDGLDWDGEGRSNSSFGAGAETQAVATKGNAYSIQPKKERQPAGNRGELPSPRSKLEAICPSTIAQDCGKECENTGPYKHIAGQNDQPTEPEHRYQSVPPAPSLHPSESQEASNQLDNDLRHATQAQPGVETESQYENAWQTYQFQAPKQPQQESLKEYVDFSQAQDYEEGLGNKPMTLPTQPWSSRNNEPVSTSKLPVPPSQATTVDVTQPSPHELPLQSSQPLPSSPPPIPPPTSSPVTGRREASPRAGCEWNGGRLTDSQLLPASLMEDSMIGPPGDWRMEQEPVYDTE